jgi:hypothetical protein
MDRNERQQIIRNISGKGFDRTESQIPGRAWEPYMKQQIIDRMMAVWEAHPTMRLGQLIGNVYHSTDPGGVKQYYVEDFELIEEMEGFYEHRKAD